MGGGDLNMKKSWHPLLLKNQERVWLEEKKALEEKKKLDQLRKEKEEERQLQELQRLQEEQTGKKRTEKLEWMYTTPATGSSQNTNDLEDYLLGKKRVDKILTADENAKIGYSHKDFIAVQNANNARDIAAKIREDPLLAIKQQEQAALQALMSNPLRLREMQQRNGIKPKKSKEVKRREKAERKRLKDELKHRSQRSPSPRRDSRELDRYSRRRHSNSPRGRRSISPASNSLYSRRTSHHQFRSMERDERYSRSPQAERQGRHRPSSRDHRFVERNARPSFNESNDSDSSRRSVERVKRRRSSSPHRGNYERTKRSRRSISPLQSARAPQAKETPDDRAARLAAMTANANVMSVERQERLAALLEKEKAELAADEAARAKSKGMGSFLSLEQKKVFGGMGGIEDRIRRGRGGLVSSID